MVLSARGRIPGVGIPTVISFDRTTRIDLIRFARPAGAASDHDQTLRLLRTTGKRTPRTETAKPTAGRLLRLDGSDVRYGEVVACWAQLSPAERCGSRDMVPNQL